MQILISEKKFSVVFLHQEFQLNLELFHTSIINKIKQKLRKKKKTYKVGCWESKDFLQRPVQYHAKRGDVWQELK